MEQKLTHTDEEIAELRKWLNEHEAQLPATIDLLPGVTVVDVPKMVHNYFELYDATMGVKIYQGQFTHLFILKEKMQEMGIV